MSTISTASADRIRVSARTAVILVAAATIAWAVQMYRLRPSPAQEHIEKGRQYTLRGQARLAEREWKAAITLEPKDTVALELLAGLYYTTENWRAAAPLYARLIEQMPGRRRTCTHLAVCLLRTGNEKAAYNAAQEALKHDPNDGTALLISAVLLSKMGDLPQEQNYLARLIEIAPDNLFVLTLAAENRTFSHDYLSARPILKRMLRLDRKCAEALMLRGICDMDADSSPQGQKRAEVDFINALRINPLLPLARLSLGKLYRRRGESPEALFQLEEARRLAPSRTDVLFELAGAYAQAGQPGKAAEARRRFEEIRQKADLQASLEKRCAVDPGYFDAHLTLGLLCLNKGDTERADTYLRRAAVLRPRDVRPQAGLRRLATLAGESGRSESAGFSAAGQIRPLR